MAFAYFGIYHMTSIKMLGITIPNHLSVGDHVRDVIGKCTQSLYALKLQRNHGMSDDSLTDKRMTCDRNTALCTKVHCAVKMSCCSTPKTVSPGDPA